MNDVVSNLGNYFCHGKVKRDDYKVSIICVFFTSYYGIVSPNKYFELFDLTHLSILIAFIDKGNVLVFQSIKV